jgi:cell division protein FtsL
VVFTLAVVMAFFLLIFSRTTLDHTAFEIKDLETRIAAEESRYWELRLEIARLQAPDRIMDAAGELNLVYPEEIRNVTVAIEGGPAMSLDDRCAELKALLSAHP